MPFKGKLTWECVFDFNLQGKNATAKYGEKKKTREKYHVRTVVENVNETAKTTTNTNNVSLSLGASYKLLSASVDTSFTNSVEVRDFMSKRIEQNKDYENEYETEVSQECKFDLYDFKFIYNIHTSCRCSSS